MAIFFYFGFFNHYFRNESDEIFFLYMILLSRANLSDVIYEGVTQGVVTCPVATLIGMMSRHTSRVS
jgi:hypothetical protein